MRAARGPACAPEKFGWGWFDSGGGAETSLRTLASTLYKGNTQNKNLSRSSRRCKPRIGPKAGAEEETIAAAPRRCLARAVAAIHGSGMHLT